MKRILLLILAMLLLAPFSLTVAIYFTYNWRPPAMFESLFPSGKRWDRKQIDAAITEILNRNFPSGSTVSEMKSSLFKEGFRDVPPPPSDCVQRTAEAPIGIIFVPCYDHSNQMEYSWSMGLVCGGRIWIRWTIDEGGKVGRIEGNERGACI